MSFARHILLAAALFLVLGSQGALAGQSVSQLAKKLLHGDDFRVRTQAALALGSTGDKKAIKPLCEGLNDDSDTVRAASAAGLGKLRLGGKDCLKKRAKKENSRNVKKMIAKAIKLITEAASGPRITGRTKLYIAIGKVSGDPDGTVRSAMSNAKPRGAVIAPQDEKPTQAKKRLRRFPRVAAYYLAPRLSIRRGGGRLTIQLELELYSYPDKQRQGSLARSAGLSGAVSKAKEKKLIEKVAREAMKQFGEMAAEVQ